MNGYIAPTDYDWFEFLSNKPDLEEVNFWQPHGGQAFRALKPGEPFFFKLKKPHNAIAGFGLFARHARVPAWLAWDSFGEANGASDFDTMCRRIERYRRDSVVDRQGSYEIGCILLSNPVFFSPKMWIPQPSDWKRQVVSGKTYNLSEGEGKRIWSACFDLAMIDHTIETHLVADAPAAYGEPSFIKQRLGQGTFRIGVVDAYDRACAVSGEHSLPALEAAHIRPFSNMPRHEVSNGVLLRSDIHRLFDRGYMTITPEHHVEVSPRLKSDFQNGKSYYPFHGALIQLPRNPLEHPDKQHLEWHNNEVFLA